MEKAYRFASIKPVCTPATHISFYHSLAVNFFARAFSRLAGHGQQQLFEGAVLACGQTGDPISKCRSICFLGGRT